MVFFGSGARRVLVGSALILGTAGTYAAAQYAPPALRATGESAEDAPTGELCASGIAIGTVFGSVCTETCVSDATCPVQWGCRQVPQGTGEPVGLCFPLR